MKSTTYYEANNNYSDLLESKEESENAKYCLEKAFKKGIFTLSSSQGIPANIVFDIPLAFQDKLECNLLDVGAALASKYTNAIQKDYDSQATIFTNAGIALQNIFSSYLDKINYNKDGAILTEACLNNLLKNLRTQAISLVIQTCFQVLSILSQRSYSSLNSVMLSFNKGSF